MKRLALSAVLFSTVAFACINDSDTLAFEIRNVDALNRITNEPDYRKKATTIQELALRAIAGRFERYPGRYYQMRINRLEALPSLSAAEYDDLAVAYDRLGNVRQAIKLIVESKPKRASKDDQYRFHANYGTFLVHRWIVGGKKESDVETLRKSIREIERALKIDPNSHFGRERVQLALQKSWLPDNDSNSNGGPFSGLSPQDIVVGLSGIAMMGLGYELPELYSIMADTHINGQAQESIFPSFARMRADELLKASKANVPSAEFKPTKEETRDYQRLRTDGEKVHRARLAYMKARFDRGEHPDTHPAFWSEWKESPFPVLTRKGGPEDEASSGIWKIVAVVLAALVPVAFIVWRVRVGIKQRRAILNSS